MAERNFKDLEKKVRKMAEKIEYFLLNELALKSKDMLKEHRIKFGEKSHHYQKVMHLSNVLILERNNRPQCFGTAREEKEELKEKEAYPFKEQQTYIKSILKILEKK